MNSHTADGTHPDGAAPGPSPEDTGTALRESLLDLTPTESRKIALEVLHQIEIHPETHDQRWWLRTGDRLGAHLTDLPAASPAEWPGCGTTACVAGHAVLAYRRLYGGFARQDYFTFAHIADAARAILGLTRGAAEDLFHSDRTRDQVLNHLRRLAHC